MSEVTAQLERVQQLINAGKISEARVSLQRLLPKHGSDVGLNRAMSMVLMLEKQWPQAIYYAKRSADLRPHDAKLWHNLGTIQGFGGKGEDAEKSFEKALELAPDDLETRRSYAKLLHIRDRLDLAATICRDGLAQHPGDAVLSTQLSGILLSAGHADEAIALLRDATSTNPDNADLASMLAFATNYSDRVTPSEAFEMHRAFGRVLERTVPRANPPMLVTFEPERRLRIGIVSPDFNSHSVAFFIEPVIQHLDRGQFEVICYDKLDRRDAVNTRLRTLADAWRDVPMISGPALAKTIYDDRIDIVLDLTGHTTHHSLLTLHYKPAPVQVTYLGYPNTTGLSTIDWRIVDRVTDPPPEADARCSEKLFRLDPCFLCYRPPKDAPELDRSSSAHGDGIVFGSFNHFQKTSDTTVALWSRVLRETPNSRIVLKNAAMYDPVMRQRVLARFAEHGIDELRFLLLDQLPGMKEHLATYDTIDVALDPTPYNGTTTTCEALFMGVPVVTLAGKVHASRVGASLLTVVGHPEWIASSEDEYVQVATSLASNAQQQRAQRSALRQQVLTSALCDEAGFAKRFGEMLRAMWRERCGKA